jgi:hypothetical protein
MPNMFLLHQTDASRDHGEESRTLDYKGTMLAMQAWLSSSKASPTTTLKTYVLNPTH